MLKVETRPDGRPRQVAICDLCGGRVKVIGMTVDERGYDVCKFCARRLVGRAGARPSRWAD